MLAFQGANVTDVAPGRAAVVAEHLVPVLRALSFQQVTERIDQGVSCERPQSEVVLHVLPAQRHLTLEAGLEGGGFCLGATVAVDAFSLLFLQGKRTEVYQSGTQRSEKILSLLISSDW